MSGKANGLGIGQPLSVGVSHDPSSYVPLGASGVSRRGEEVLWLRSQHYTYHQIGLRLHISGNRVSQICLTAHRRRQSSLARLLGRLAFSDRSIVERVLSEAE